MNDGLAEVYQVRTFEDGLPETGMIYSVPDLTMDIGGDSGLYGRFVREQVKIFEALENGKPL